jgi:heptosyltransferase-1
MWQKICWRQSIGSWHRIPAEIRTLLAYETRGFLDTSMLIDGFPSWITVQRSARFMGYNRLIETVEDRRTHILIIKLSAIGDVVHSLPLLEALRDSFPLARIDWLVEEDASGIVEGHPCIDELFIFPRKTWLKRLSRKGEVISTGKEVACFLKGLRMRRYDIVIDLQGLLKSGLLTFLARGKRKIALNNGREGSKLFVQERVAVPRTEMHALEKYLCIARHLGVKNPRWDGYIPIYKGDKAYVDSLLGELAPDRILIAINPMAKWETKLWAPDRFASLADRINEKLEAGVIFTGSGADKGPIGSIQSKMKTEALNLAGMMTLKQLASFYQRCTVVISTDTGPMHIAAAMKAPMVVALFGPTSPLRTGPYGTSPTVVSSGAPCSPCFKKRCDDMRCMRQITVDMVYDAVKEALTSRFHNHVRNRGSREQITQGVDRKEEAEGSNQQ